MTKEFELSDISERLSNLSPSRRKLLLQRLAKQAKRRANDAGPILPISRDQNTALSFAQQRLWFLDQLAPGNPFYNIVAAVRCKGSLDVAAFEKSLNEIVRRHEALRTTFPSVGGKPVQAISPSLVLHLPITDIAEFPESEREQEAQRLASEEALWPFDLAAGPLVRASLLKIDERDHVFLLNMHHIISDGWSMGVFIRELVSLYEAFTEAKPSPLPELQIQYADFAHWQREWLQGEVLGEQISYWKRQLKDMPALELPADRPRPDVEYFHGKQHAIHISRSLTESLKALSLREEATLFMTLLAAFKILLYRYTGQSDIAIGTAIANRNRAETEGLIGFFVNSLVLRTLLSDNPSFIHLLARVRDV
ncbi:MAG: condensation domain-containing protein, partial [Blastocatellia bacterium]